jgi:hypothetical protein
MVCTVSDRRLSAPNIATTVTTTCGSAETTLIQLRNWMPSLLLSRNNITLGNDMASPRRKDAPAKRAPAVSLPGLATRPAWQGHLRLSLVSCSVGLYTATTTASDISFNMINPATGNRIKMVTTDPDTGPVERSSLVKGYEVEKNNYVLFTDEEIKAVKL